MRSTMIVWLLLAFTIALPGDMPAQSPGNPEQRLIERTTQYYATMKRGDWAGVWAFMGEAMRRDNPKHEYVAEMNAMFPGTIHGTSTPTIISMGKSESGQAVGKVHTTLHTELKGVGDKKDLLHTTFWIWKKLPDSDREDWYLFRDQLGPAPSRQTSSLRP